MKTCPLAGRRLRLDRVRRAALIVAGLLSVGLGAVGIFVPLLPTTPFLLLAAACFVRSSGRLHNWLMHHPWFGRSIRQYRDHHALPRRAKVGALVLLWSGIGYSASSVASTWGLRVALFLIAIAVSAHLLRLKSMG